MSVSPASVGHKGELVKKLRSIGIVLLAAIAFSACQKAANTNVSVAPANTAANTANAVSPANSPEPETAKAAPGSPTEVYKTAHTARQKKDIATLKKIFAKDILEFFTEIGKVDKKSLDDMLLEMCKDAKPGEAEVRNEKITGETATLEYNEDGKWKTMDFVKEDGAWKMTIAKPGPGEVTIENDPKKGK